MTKSTSIRLVMAFLLPAMVADVAIGQHLKLKEREIGLLVEEWNIVHNGRELLGFDNLYADSLLFYTQRLPKSKAIVLKQKLFNKNTDFRQRITTDIDVSAFEHGVLKCDFTKEVWDNSEWKSYPSYLLVKFVDNRFQIVGESDYVTDRRLKYKLALGKEMDVSGDSVEIVINESSMPDKKLEYQADERKKTTSPADSAEIVANKPSATDDSSMIAHTDKPIGIDPGKASEDVVTVPKLYVFILIGLLVAGGLVIFFSESARRKRKNRFVKDVHVEEQKHLSHREVVNEVPAEKVYEEEIPIMETEAPTTHLEKKHAFESLIISLFDPLYFSYRKQKFNPVLASDHTDDELAPGLEFQFQNKDTDPIRFAIQCIYLDDVAAEELRLFPEERLRMNRQLMDELNIDLYYVIGLGGTADNPAELYLLPGRLLKYELVHKKALEPFRKFGMFFYNAATGKLR
jgi:hypothetical protein